MNQKKLLNALKYILQYNYRSKNSLQQIDHLPRKKLTEAIIDPFMERAKNEAKVKIETERLFEIIIFHSRSQGHNEIIRQ